MGGSTTIEIGERVASGTPVATLTLPFVTRQKSRQRATLDDGRDALLILARGSVLRGGDLLRAADGTIVLVRAAAEPVSTARGRDAIALARAAYHLGNRHVPLEIGDGWVRYEHDHVLDAMVRGLGLEVAAESASFEPEGGAYGGAEGGRGHGHGREGRHDHGHDHHEH